MQCVLPFGARQALADLEQLNSLGRDNLLRVIKGNPQSLEILTSQSESSDTNEAKR
jgi:hypothetical protein